MTAFPAKSALTGGTVTEGGFKTALDQLVDAITERLVDGTSIITNFTSTGIDDNASATIITIADALVTCATHFEPSANNTYRLGSDTKRFSELHATVIKLAGSALGTMATQNASSVAITGGSITGITAMAIADGGTGATTASGARDNLGGNAAGARTVEAEAAGAPTGGANGDIVYQY